MPVPQPLRNLASEAFADQNWDALEFHARRMLQQDAADATGRSYLGVALCSTGRVEEGLREHAKAVQLGSDQSMTWHNYATGLLLTRDYARALTAIQRALELEPIGYRTWRILLSAHANLFQIDEASQVVAQVFALFGDEEVEKDPLGFRASRLRSPDGIHEFSPSLLAILVTREEGSEIVCEDADLGIYGVGPTFSEAYSRFGEMFLAVFADYPDGFTDPLSDGARQHATARIDAMDEATRETEEDAELMRSLERGRRDIGAGRTVVWGG